MVPGQPERTVSQEGEVVLVGGEVGLGLLGRRPIGVEPVLVVEGQMLPGLLEVVLEGEDEPLHEESVERDPGVDGPDVLEASAEVPGRFLRAGEDHALIDSALAVLEVEAQDRGDLVTTADLVLVENPSEVRDSLRECFGGRTDSHRALRHLFLPQVHELHVAVPAEVLQLGERRGFPLVRLFHVPQGTPQGIPPAPSRASPALPFPVVPVWAELIVHGDLVATVGEEAHLHVYTTVLDGSFFPGEEVGHIPRWSYEFIHAISPFGFKLSDRSQV